MLKYDIFVKGQYRAARIDLKYILLCYITFLLTKNEIAMNLLLLKEDDKKIEMFEYQLKQFKLRKFLEEKDIKIINLKKKFQNMQ